jgi:hypothetical protein
MGLEKFMKDIEYVFSLIDRYGIPLVFLVYIVWKWLTPWIKHLQDRNEKLEDEGKEISHLDEVISVENCITEVLAQTAHLFDAQWVTLWQLHNGTVSVDNIPFIRMSVTHEFVATGFEPRLPNYQNIPISVFAKELIALRRDKVLFVAYDSPEYPAVANSYVRDGLNHGAFVCINNSRGNLIGVMSIGWHDASDVLTASQVVEFQAFSVRASILLAQLATYRHAPHRRVSDG